MNRPVESAPAVRLRYLETLWLQVTGTLCNLACRHCFISCGPKNDTQPFMTVDQVATALDEARSIGVKDYYFTGGEPFLHPEVLTLIDMTLAQGPLSILTNGVLIDAAMARALKERFDASPYSFDLRVSLDGTTAETNDPIRGRGTFEEILAGVRALADVGLNPVLTVTEVDDGEGPAARVAFRQLLADVGLEKPRLKYLAPFRIGREARRGRGYETYEVLPSRLSEEDAAALQCSTCRMVTAKGVYPCPILVDDDAARLGDTLQEAPTTVRLKHAACYTCHVEGISCRT